jgi:hypothetical protein
MDMVSMRIEALLLLCKKEKIIRMLFVGGKMAR